MRVLALCGDLIPACGALVATKLLYLEGKRLACRNTCDLPLDGEGVIEIIRQVAAFPANFDWPALHVFSVVLVGLLVVALDDLQLPAGFGCGLAEMKPSGKTT